MRESPFRSLEESKALRELHEAIGGFAVAFERVCAGMRSCIVLSLERRGLATQSLAHLLVAQRSARSLASLLPAVYREFNADDHEGHAALDRIVKRIDKLREQRNLAIHAPWILGIDDSEALDFPQARAVLFKPNKRDGLRVLELNYEPADFDKLTDEAIELQVYLTRLQICINQPRFRLSEQFRRPTGRPRST